MVDASREIRLLLVDDDVDVAEMYALQLVAEGFGVTTAHSGTEAIHLAGTVAPHLIFLDLRLPEMDGFEVLEELNAAPVTAGIPVVILTNFSEPELIERGKALGAHDYLIKAHTPPALLAATALKWLPAQGTA
ncbi:MAG TPA: response regulator [Candidatus Saccharimonadales bacterium]|nr:response regulator [Candidatus Saccharimonadales bacterium]